MYTEQGKQKVNYRCPFGRENYGFLGLTIRKVIGEGGIFVLHEFFSVPTWCMNFFSPVHEYFFRFLCLARLFCVPHPHPTPLHHFSNGRPIMKERESLMREPRGGVQGVRTHSTYIILLRRRPNVQNVSILHFFLIISTFLQLFP